MWQSLVIQFNGWKLDQGTREVAFAAYRASMESTLTLFAFLYNDKGELVETFIPTVVKK
jgi:hypothetical protein